MIDALEQLWQGPYINLGLQLLLVFLVISVVFQKKGPPQ